MIGTNSRDLVRRALRGEAAPRVPCGPLAVHYCAAHAGVSIEQYTLNARVLADCVLEYYEAFRPDAVWVSADTWVSAEAMGASVAFPADNQPLGGTGDPLVRTAADIDRIPPPDPANRGRMPLMLEAVQRVVEAIGRDAWVVACFDQSPFSLACALAGIDGLMTRLVDDPPFVEALVERCVEHAVAYGAAMAGAGADMLSTGDSPAALIGPRFYREFALPAERRVFERLRPTGKALSLHICGDTTRILADMASSGADVLEIDHAVDLEAACTVVPDSVALWGNIDPVAVLSRGATGDVAHAAGAAIETVRARGRRRFVLSSGCTLPLETPGANLETLLAAAGDASVDDNPGE